MINLKIYTMKKFVLVIALQLFVLQMLCAQSISESLGGIKTNFEISTINTDLEVTEQIIVLAAERLLLVWVNYQDWDISFTTKEMAARHNLPITARRYNFVSVTQRSIRAGSWYFSQITVTVRGEYGAVFAFRVQTLWTIRVSRYKADRKQVTSQGTQNFIAGTSAVAA